MSTQVYGTRCSARNFLARLQSGHHGAPYTVICSTPRLCHAEVYQTRHAARPAGARFAQTPRSHSHRNLGGVDTMMGPSHALSGAAAWLAGSWALDHFADYHQSPLQVAVGTAVCAGGALLPDLDMSGRVTSGKGGATVAHTFGRVSLFVAEVIEKVSLGAYNATKMKR